MTDPLPAEALDPVHLARQTFDDRDLGRELLELLEEQCGRLLPVLAGPGPSQGRSAAAHTLKGAARAVGAWRLALAADRLETALDKGGGEVGLLVADIDRAMRETRLAARRWMDGA